jgi:3-deoxy-D-manno-oct-2-ulosonic acid (Kdo) hydroxylase
MTDIVSLPIAVWDHQYSATDQERALYALEHGSVLFFPQLRFSMEEVEGPLLSPAIAATSKNVSLDCSKGVLRGSSAGEAELRLLQNMMQRFANGSGALLRNLLPRYQAGLMQGRTSFRPVEIANRSTSWRKDDTRLHVDSFPSSPVQDKRILRVFSNISPNGQSRTWRLGESFENVASRYLPSTPGPVWGVSPLLKALGITKGRRSAYDHFMLRLHDRMKADMDYQAKLEQMVFEFPADSSWIAFTDQVSHAATKGQYALEQTYYLPVTSMLDPSQAPQRILQRLAGRELI